MSFSGTIGGTSEQSAKVFPRKSSFPPIRKSFLPQKFPAIQYKIKFSRGHAPPLMIHTLCVILSVEGLCTCILYLMYALKRDQKKRPLKSHESSCESNLGFSNYWSDALTTKPLDPRQKSRSNSAYYVKPGERLQSISAVSLSCGQVRYLL